MKMVKPEKPCEVCPFIKDCKTAGTEHEKYCVVYVLTKLLWARMDGKT